MSPDYELWQAAHAECGEDGCGKCKVINVDFSDEDFFLIQAAALLAGESFEVFVQRALDIKTKEFLDKTASHGVD